MKKFFGIAVLFLTVFTALTAQEISPYLIGQNHWLDNGDEGRVGYLHLLWPAVNASGVKTVRIGGNGYNRNLPQPARLSAIIDSIRHIGAEPFLQVPADFTTLRTMELVERFTRDGDRRVKYWSIGNEPLLHDEFTIDEVHTYIMRIAPAIKKVDPSAKIFVFDECELREKAYETLCGGRLDITGLKENGAWLIDGFSYHKYPNGRDFDRDNVLFSGPETIRRMSETLVGMMEKADRKHHRHGKDKLMWALTEVNVTYANPDRDIRGIGNPSFLGGQFMAEIFGICMEFGAFTVNPWCISETDAVSTDFGYIGLHREFYPRSSYYHMQMIAENMTGQYVATSNNQKRIKTIGAKDGDKICVMVMNQDLNQNYDYDIFLNGKGKSTKSLTIHADAGLDQRVSGTIENQTTRLYVFDKEGKLQKQVTYGLMHNLKHGAPVVSRHD